MIKLTEYEVEKLPKCIHFSPPKGPTYANALARYPNLIRESLWVKEQQTSFESVGSVYLERHPSWLLNQIVQCRNKKKEKWRQEVE